ncbi:MAG TPA: hypothetical protein VEJ00_12645 [Candidatus Acidoferrales bacterium]|jgi:hypothetical protein|nr:hypothetical protein [Candidatus Acidoferrales bacterium]
MTDSEKWSVWTLGVIALTTTAYFIFVALRGHGPATISVFALTALVAINKRSFRSVIGPRFDERESEIARKALLTSFRVMWLAVVAGFVITGHIKGWDTTLSLPMWKLAEIFWWLSMLMLAVQAGTTLLLYRRGNNA